MSNTSDNALINVDLNQFHQIQSQALVKPDDLSHPPRILLLYGSLRERSFSRLDAYWKL
jgi:arsenic resistance protein ArsH